MLRRLTPSSDERLLVDATTGDDAAVWRIDASRALIVTADIITPVVDDARAWGRVAATNAVSDVYAMGGRPILALAILGMPVDKIAPDTVREILKGGAAVCASAGIPVAGGHSIDCPEPVYGLAVIGICRPEHVRRNSAARPGDALIMTKGIGVGIYSAALKKGALPADGYTEMLASTTLLNRIGADLALKPEVHAMTDVTGFGLLGHGLEMARGSDVTVVIEADKVPLLESAAALAQQGYVTGASKRNWESYGEAVALARSFPDWRRQLLTDPQTSGGLLVSCDPAHAQRLVALLRESGYPSTAIVGRCEPGRARIRVV